MTPVQLEVLLHCFYVPTMHPRSEFPAVREAYAYLKAKSLVEADTHDGVDFYRTTDRGNAHVRQLCNLPVPTSVLNWIGADGKVIPN